MLRMSVLVSFVTFIAYATEIEFCSEARKADLRRVEMELDEADEMVCADSQLTIDHDHKDGTCRSRKWRLKYKGSRSP